MAKLRSLSGREERVVLMAFGFREVRRSDNQIVMQKRTEDSTVTVSVPNHPSLGIGKFAHIPLGELNVLSGREACHILGRCGFVEVPRSSGHIVMQKRSGQLTITVPVLNHSKLTGRVLRSIIRQSRAPQSFFGTVKAVNALGKSRKNLF